MNLPSRIFYPIVFSLFLGIILTIILQVKPFLLSSALFCVVALAVWFGSLLSISFGFKLFPRIKYRYKHLLIILPIQFLLFLVTTYLILTFLNYYKIVNTEDDFSVIFTIAVLSTLFFTASFEGIDFFLHWKKYVLNTERLEKANLVAKYETLKKQVHPHFLFNGLNTLIGLIENNDKKAGEYTQKLADFLKYLLTYQQKESITLHEELEIVKQYAFIQQVRFNENLHVEYKIDEALNKKKVPPLAIQMLVENAIKHNVVSNSNPLTISIESIDGLSLKVENSLCKKKHVESAFVGLENIKERYKYLSKREPQVIESDQKFIVIIPLI